MKKPFLSLLLFTTLLLSGGSILAAEPAAPPAVTPAPAPATAPAKAEPDDKQRLADLEAEVSNGARGSDAADAKVSSKLDGVPSPGHNAWQMASAALVLFMTLPGLALFYGGLVRRKNVLS